MKNILKYLLIIFAAYQGLGQNYVQLDAFDVNRFPIEESDLQGLNTASDAICQLFDTLGFNNQFKVFDIGTYTLQESTKENFGGFLEIARQKIGQTSAYYVIFCRVGDKNDFFRELTLDIKLPTVGRFQCLSNSKRSNLAKIYSSTVNEYLSTLGDRNRNFGKAQIWALDSIYKELKSIVDCCVPTVRSQSCSQCLSDSERKHTLESQGFISIPIDSTFQPLVVGLVNEGDRSSKLTITKYSNRKIFIGSEEVQIAENITSFISNIENLEEDVSVWITSNKNLCAENEFDLAKAESEISQSKIKAHFHIDEDSKLLYIRDMSEIILDYSACKPDTTPIEKRFPVFFANWPNVIKVPKYKASYLALNYGFEQSYISRALKFANQIGAFENQMYFFEETKPSHTNRALGPFAVVATTCDNPTTAVVDVQLWKHIFTNPPKSLVGKDYLWLECDNQFDLENNIIPTFEDLGKVSYFYVENLELPWYFPSPNTVKTVAKVVPKISSGSRVLKFQKVLNNTGKIQKILLKLDGLDAAKAFVNTLDEVADATLLNKIDNLSATKLEALDNFYKNIKSNTPKGFGNNDFHFTATKEIEFTGTKYVNGQAISVSNTSNVSVVYKNGFPQFQNTPHCPTMNYPNGTAGKFKYVNNNLNSSNYSNHFNLANEGLATKFGKGTNSWPAKNADGFHEVGNYRWDAKSAQFELKNTNGVWEKYTWHHVEDGKTIIPVLSSVHSPAVGGFKHAGGNKILEYDIKGVFVFTGY